MLVKIRLFVTSEVTRKGRLSTSSRKLSLARWLALPVVASTFRPLKTGIWFSTGKIVVTRWISSVHFTLAPRAKHGAPVNFADSDPLFAGILNVNVIRRVSPVIRYSTWFHVLGSLIIYRWSENTFFAKLNFNSLIK